MDNEFDPVDIELARADAKKHCKPKWISVNNRLPKDQQRVLTFNAWLDSKYPGLGMNVHTFDRHSSPMGA